MLLVSDLSVGFGGGGLPVEASVRISGGGCGGVGDPEWDPGSPDACCCPHPSLHSLFRLPSFPSLRLQKRACSPILGNPHNLWNRWPCPRFCVSDQNWRWNRKKMPEVNFILFIFWCRPNLWVGYIPVVSLRLYSLPCCPTIDPFWPKFAPQLPSQSRHGIFFTIHSIYNRYNWCYDFDIGK